MEDPILPSVRQDDSGALKAKSKSSPLQGSKKKPALEKLSSLKGAGLIRSLVKNCPSCSGVYRMISDSGQVLYVGKAKNLRKRVASYARSQKMAPKIQQMVNSTAAMEFVVTRSETEALLLEANLIKCFRPKYNVLMRDDKSFPSILITSDHPWPGIFRHRGQFSGKADRFGPFASAGAVAKTINSLQRIFLLRNCRDSFFKNRTRPCLLYQVKRCSAPCTGEISKADYAELVSEAKEFLAGRSQKVADEIASRMQKASESLDFERAAFYRDRLTALSHVLGHQGVDLHNLRHADVFALFREGGEISIQVFFFRNGQNCGGKAFFLEADPLLKPSGILSSFLAQFYDSERAPSLVFVSELPEEPELLARALSLRAGHAVSIVMPRKGQKRDIVDHALQNAQQALLRKLSGKSSQKKLLQAFSSWCNLKKVPTRIEVYDNSHISGTSPVGVMVVAGSEGFMKSHYRKFNMRGDSLSFDDYAMMREVLSRRFAGAVKSTRKNEEGFVSWPDVILIDGGLGQMSVAREILAQHDPEETIFALAIAKGKNRNDGCERLFLRDGKEIFLDPGDPVFFFLQRLRDEAHRFAVGSHRIRRKKGFYQSSLDDIPGIGAARKRALLLYFGTVKAISRAGVNNLVQVEGISRALALQICRYFE